MTVLTRSVTAFFDGALPLDPSLLFPTLASLPQVTVRGMLDADGVLHAEVLEVRAPGVARLRGVVGYVDPARNQVLVRLDEIPDGVEVLAPFLESQTSSYLVGIDAGTAAVIERRPFPSISSIYDLRVGLLVGVELSLIQAPSPIASRIAIEDRRPELSGVFAEQGPLGEIMLDVDEYDPARVFRRFSRVVSTIPAEVTPGTVFVVDLDHELPINLGPSLAGTALRVRGEMNNSYVAPELTSEVVKVSPGCLEGVVTGFAPFVINVAWDSECRPFGGAQLGNPVVATLDPNCRVLGDADSQQELLDRLVAMAPGERARVRVQGVKDALGGVSAYEVTLRIE